MAFGVTEQGFVRKRLADIQTEIEDSLRTLLGNQINLLPESVFGQIVGIFAERESLIWEVAEDVYNSAFPNSSFGVNLDNAVQFNAITRQGAQPSVQSQQRFFGDPLTVIPAGTLFQVQGNPQAQFQIQADLTLQAGQSAIDLLSFSAVPDSGTFRLNFRGQDTTDLPFNATAQNVQDALTALEFGTGIEVTGDFSAGFTIAYNGDAGLQEQDLIVVDDNVLQAGVTPVDITPTNQQVGINQGAADVVAVATGPTLAPAGTLNTIVNPISGLTRTINVTDATIGRDVETDNELRERREETLQAAGAASINAILARIQELDGVTDAFVFENDSLITDPDGREGKSYEVVVAGGQDATIFQTVLDTKPAGIKTEGQLESTIPDSNGQPRTVRFSRPTDVDIYLEVDLNIDQAEFPSNGIALAESALVTQGNTFGIGGDVIVVPRLVCALDDIPGILGVTIRIGKAPSPTLSENIPIAANEVSVFDTSRTQVVAV